MKVLIFLIGVAVGIAATMLFAKFINWLCEGMDDSGYHGE